ncbi:MAG TPA: hypothetical protein VLG47_07920 [Candidatus Saccharimonadales bacterium]|nr:hypothetical protein [Candidatus Saccharimonadales bacterium]
MIAALRNWLLLALFMVGALTLWENVSISGWMNIWSRQCYSHANSVACNYGSVDTAAALAAITVFVVCMWLFVKRIKLFSWWTLFIGSVIFAASVTLANWYVFTHLASADGTFNTGVVIQFLSGRGDVVAAAIGATVVVIMQSLFKPGDAK